METYAIAAFRSRQAVFRFEATLNALAIENRIISTPRAVSLGCGLSLRFDLAQLPKALAAYDKDPVPNLIGFYHVESGQGGLQVTPARRP